jgi:hypothetical protein
LPLQRMGQAVEIQILNLLGTWHIHGMGVSGMVPNSTLPSSAPDWACGHFFKKQFSTISSGNAHSQRTSPRMWHVDCRFSLTWLDTNLRLAPLLLPWLSHQMCHKITENLN